MQIILTEEEYLKLKNKSAEDRRDFVKKTDVAMALAELIEDIGKLPYRHVFSLNEYSNEYLKKIVEEFWKSIEQEKN